MDSAEGRLEASRSRAFEVDTVEAALLFVEAVGLQSYRELRRRGVCHNLPGSTVKSAHGPWHLSRSHAGTVLRHSGITTALRTKSSPSRTAWYVIRMPGGVGGVAPRGAVLT